MKKLTLVAIATIATFVAGAQIQFGGKAGLNLANLSVSPAESGTSYKMTPNFHIGGLVQIPLAGSLSLQPEVVYSGQGTKVTSGNESGTINVGYINVPVLLKYKTASGFFAEAGPQLGFLMSAKAKSDGVSVDAKDSFNSTDFAAVLGVGYVTSMNIGANLRYNYGFSNISKSSGETVKNGVIQLSVFFLFGGSGK